MDEFIKDMCDYTDLWPWYWLSYGEKCYAFATVAAYPIRDKDPFPKYGSQLFPDHGCAGGWVGENGVGMIIDSEIASIERQNGDVICRFIANVYANVMREYLPKE